MQIRPSCCCYCSEAPVNERALSLSSAQHQHLPDECAQQRKGRRTEEGRGREDILDKGDDKSMTIMELRRWGMSDLRKRTVKIWQRNETKGYSWLLFFFFPINISLSSFYISAWTLKASNRSKPRMSRKVNSGSIVCTTGNKTHPFSPNGNKRHPARSFELVNEDEKQL